MISQKVAETFFLTFFLHKKTGENCENNQRSFKKVLFYFLGPYLTNIHLVTQSLKPKQCYPHLADMSGHSGEKSVALTNNF
jgi:hypothetical protein